MKETLSERLGFLLSNLNIKQRDFAERVGFTQSYLSMILNGSKQSPSARFFEAVAREFSVNPDWLHSGAGEMYQAVGSAFSPADAEIMARYRLLPPAEQGIVDQIINALLLKSLQEKNDA